MKKQPYISRILRSWRVICLLVLLIVGSVVVYPRNSEGAACSMCNNACWWLCNGTFPVDPVEYLIRTWGTPVQAAGEAKKYIQAMTWVTNLIRMYNAFMDGLNSIINLDRLARLMQIFTEWLHARTTVLLADAKIHADAASNKAAEDKKAAMESSPAEADQFLCNVLKLRMSVPIMQQFADMVTAFLGKGMDAIGRGPADLGNSAQHSADYLRMECGDVESYPEKTGNATDLMPERCRAQHSVPGATTADGYMNAEVLAWGNVFTLPPVTRQSITEGGATFTVSRMTPDPEDETQKRFMMATQYCNTLAGSHASPVHGAQKFTAASIVKDGRHIDCRTLQYEFTSRCAARIGKLTRPDCSQTEYKAFCDSSMEACAAAKTAGLDLTEEYHDCPNGLNLYQLERLSVMMCGSSRRQQSEGAQGRKPGEQAPILTYCSQMKEYWDEQIANEQRELNAAILGIVNNRECFVGTGK